MFAKPANRQPPLCPRRSGFTLLELLVVVAIIAVLASLLLPALGRSQAKSRGALCLNNTRQLVTAWLMYADDNRQRLPYNLGGPAARTNSNWAAGVLDWELTPDNTNTADLTEAALGFYVGQTAKVYRCPSDREVSGIQSGAGWSARVRSYSMNASVGDAGELTQTGSNVNNPNYVQFFTLTSIPNPSAIFVFLDEHPDSISDGYFVLHNYSPVWIRLPASYHNGAASFSFADGHLEAHRWVCPSTLAPLAPDTSGLPIDTTDDQRDFNWVVARMSVRHPAPWPTNSY
jgi:prepilin-type N-terminal cleavage/methylation domain-containing protein/prepilin-type processing-associated H-X9-DG protein